MKAFHGDPEIKEEFLRRVREHRAADQLIKGTYWENGKGCAVGCTVHSSCHKDYETVLGIPSWLARLEDVIFENLSNEAAMQWPEQFLAAIPVGANVDQCKPRVMIAILDIAHDSIKGNSEIEARCKKEVAAVQTLWMKPATPSAELSAALSAALSAESEAAWSARLSVESARSAAWSAAWSARSAAESAESAVSPAWSARSAAWSARLSAWSAAAAWSAAWERIRDEVLCAMREVEQ